MLGTIFWPGAIDQRILLEQLFVFFRGGDLLLDGLALVAENRRANPKCVARGEIGNDKGRFKRPDLAVAVLAGDKMQRVLAGRNVNPVSYWICLWVTTPAVAASEL